MTTQHTPACEAADRAAGRTAECACGTRQGDDTQADPGNAAFVAGNMAFWQGAHYARDNPYTDRNLSYQWSKGWLAAEEDCNRDAMRHSPEAQAMLDNDQRSMVY